MGIAISLRRKHASWIIDTHKKSEFVNVHNNMSSSGLGLSQTDVLVTTLQQIRIRSFFAIWRRQRQIHSALCKRSLIQRRRILASYFSYWMNLHSAYSKIWNISDVLRNRKLFFLWALNIRRKKTTQEAFMELIAFRRRQYLAIGFRGFIRLRKLIRLYETIPPRNDIVLCDKVFRAFHMIKLKKAHDKKRQIEVEEMCSEYKTKAFFLRWKTTLSLRRRTRLFLRNWGRYLKDKYLTLMEHQKRVSTRLRVCFRQMTASNNHAMLSKAFFRWQDKHFDFSCMCKKAKQLQQKLKKIQMKYILKKMKIACKTRQRFRELELEVESKYNVFSFAKCFQIWREKALQRENLRISDTNKVKQFLHLKKQILLRRWLLKSLKGKQMRENSKEFRRRADFALRQTHFLFWKNKFRAHKIAHDRWVHAKKLRARVIMRVPFRSLHKFAVLSKRLKSQTHAREMKIKRIVFARLIRQHQQCRRYASILAAVLKHWSLSQKRKAFAGWREYISLRHQHEDAYEAAAQTFKENCYAAIIRSFILGSDIRRRPRVAAVVAPPEQLPPSNVLELEAKLKAMTNSHAPVSQIISLLKEINHLRSAQDINYEVT